MRFKGCLYDTKTHEVLAECSAWTDCQCSKALETLRCNASEYRNCIYFTASRWKYNVLKYTGFLHHVCKKKIARLLKEYYEPEESNGNFEQDLEHWLALQLPPK